MYYTEYRHILLQTFINVIFSESWCKLTKYVNHISRIFLAHKYFSLLHFYLYENLRLDSVK